LEVQRKAEEEQKRIAEERMKAEEEQKRIAEEARIKAEAEQKRKEEQEELIALFGTTENIGSTEGAN
jgi:hypothetical protein